MAGVWIVDFELASFLIGEEIDPEDARKYLSKQIHEFDNGQKWFIVDFIEFQYKKLSEEEHKPILNMKSPVHKKVYDLLLKHKIEKNVVNAMIGQKSKEVKGEKAEYEKVRTEKPDRRKNNEPYSVGPTKEFKKLIETVSEKKSLDDI